MSFYCIRCSRNFANNQSLKRHYQRKFKCIGVVFNQNKTAVCPKYSILAEKIYPKYSMVSLKSQHSENTDVFIDNTIKSFSCKYCGTSFTHKSSVYRHHKKCYIKRENDKKKKIKELENKIVELESKLKEIEVNNHQIISQNNYNNHSHNYKIQNNNLINVTINGFGNENVESISKKEILEILNKRFEAFPAALEKIYTIPENQNFYLPNKRDKKYIKVFDGTKAYYEDSNDFMYKLSNKIMNQLENWFKTHNKHIKVQRRKLMEHVFDIFNDGQLYERYKKEIDKFLMNYSNSVKLVFEQNIQNIRNQISIIENS